MKKKRNRIIDIGRVIMLWFRLILHRKGVFVRFMWICVGTVSLFSLFSTYPCYFSLATLCLDRFRRAYESNIVLIVFIPLGVCLRTSKSLSVGEFDNSNSYRIFRLITRTFIIVLSSLYHFICYSLMFSFVLSWQVPYQHYRRKGAKNELERGKEHQNWSFLPVMMNGDRHSL